MPSFAINPKELRSKIEHGNIDLVILDVINFFSDFRNNPKAKISRDELLNCRVGLTELLKTNKEYINGHENPAYDFVGSLHTLLNAVILALHEAEKQPNATRKYVFRVVAKKLARSKFRIEDTLTKIIRARPIEPDIKEMLAGLLEKKTPEDLKTAIGQILGAAERRYGKVPRSGKIKNALLKLFSMPGRGVSSIKNWWGEQTTASKGLITFFLLPFGSLLLMVSFAPLISPPVRPITAFTIIMEIFMWIFFIGIGTVMYICTQREETSECSQGDDVFGDMLTDGVEVGILAVGAYEIGDALDIW